MVTKDPRWHWLEAAWDASKDESVRELAEFVREEGEDIIAEEDDADERVAALITLSGKMMADGAFARQLRRKYA